MAEWIDELLTPTTVEILGELTFDIIQGNRNKEQ